MTTTYRPSRTVGDSRPSGAHPTSHTPRHGPRGAGMTELDPVVRTVEERTAVVIRLFVVLSVGLAMVIGPQLARGNLAPVGVLAAVAFGYATALAVGEWREARLLPPWLATSIDGALVLVACALTGGADSIMVAALPLVVIAAAVRG
ncbi:MAG: hypothetical protein ACREQ5_38335, partial [Candidatus Dormibacteria bacterium]